MLSTAALHSRLVSHMSVSGITIKKYTKRFFKLTRKCGNEEISTDLYVQNVYNTYKLYQLSCKLC